jgi:hypothetical protein
VIHSRRVLCQLTAFANNAVFYASSLVILTQNSASQIEIPSIMVENVEYIGDDKLKRKNNPQKIESTFIAIAICSSSLESCYVANLLKTLFL